ncbi:hypothetical protein [Streptomyces olivaceiscleroticus]|uniref:Uncharacterized protein n=1 Tax=Streptomyces olivaceiscleroticus TaxID=68245 RepID=A0ABN1BCG3_9ACTN
MTVFAHWRRTSELDIFGDADFQACIPPGRTPTGVASFSARTWPTGTAWVALAEALGGMWIIEYAEQEQWRRLEADGTLETIDELAAASESLLELREHVFPSPALPPREANPQFVPLGAEDWDFEPALVGALARGAAPTRLTVQLDGHGEGIDHRPLMAAAARSTEARIDIEDRLLLVRSLRGEELIGLSLLICEGP